MKEGEYVDSKRFPANTSLDCLTFLNDKKIDGELYAYFQEKSNFTVIDKEKYSFDTYVLKSNLPS